MDEMLRLQSLRAAPLAATGARAQAAFALEQAIGGRRRRLRPAVVVIAFVAAAVLATAAYALYQEVIVGSAAPVSRAERRADARRGQDRAHSDQVPRTPRHRDRENAGGRRDLDPRRPHLPLGRPRHARRRLFLAPGRRR